MFYLAGGSGEYILVMCSRYWECRNSSSSLSIRLRKASVSTHVDRGYLSIALVVKFNITKHFILRLIELWFALLKHRG